jgi:hypothetical protein
LADFKCKLEKLSAAAAIYESTLEEISDGDVATAN